MAAPLAAAAKLLIKPVVNELKKAAIKKAAATGTAQAAGLGAREIAKLTNLDVLNLVRAATVKGTKKEVAKSLGISVKDLNATLKDITLTEQRKAAVKGANYVKNANRFLKNPVKTIAGQGKRIIGQEIGDLSRQAIDGIKSDREQEQEGNKQKILLDMLQADLYEVSKSLELDSTLWDDAAGLDADRIEQARYNVGLDMTLTVSAFSELDQYDYIIVSEENGGQGGGYQNAISYDEYIRQIEDYIRQGYTIIPHTGGIL